MPPRYYKPKEKNAAAPQPIVAGGQWTPGALTALGEQMSGKATGNVSGGTTRSAATPNVTPFVTLPSGQVGSLVNQPVTDLSQMTPAFAAKAEQALSQQVMPQSAPAQVSNPAGASLFAPNTTNPFAPNFSGTPPLTGFEQTAGAEGTIPQQQQRATSVFGARVDAMATGIVNAALDFVQGLGNGDFARGIASLITIPLTAGSAMTAADDWVYASMKEDMAGVATKEAWDWAGLKKLVKPTTAGVVTKEAIRTGGVKTASTIKTATAKWFTPQKIYEFVKAGLSTNPRFGEPHVDPWKVLKVVGGVGGVMMMATWLRVSGLESQATGTRDKKEETAGYFATIARDMYRDGNYAAGNMFLDMAVAGTNETVSAMPGGKGVVQGANYFQGAINETAPILKEHYARMAEMEAGGSTPETNAQFWTQYHANVEANKTAEEKTRVDYYNSERLRVEQEIAAARAKSNTSERAADKKAAADLAAFWLDYQKKLAALEEEERIKQAKFWLEYRKMVIKIQEETGRSRLGFGLFR